MIAQSIQSDLPKEVIDKTCQEPQIVQNTTEYVKNKKFFSARNIAFIMIITLILLLSGSYLYLNQTASKADGTSKIAQTLTAMSTAVSDTIKVQNDGKGDKSSQKQSQQPSNQQTKSNQNSNNRPSSSQPIKKNDNPGQQIIGSGNGSGNGGDGGDGDDGDDDQNKKKQGNSGLNQDTAEQDQSQSQEDSKSNSQLESEDTEQINFYQKLNANQGVQNVGVTRNLLHY